MINSKDNYHPIQPPKKRTQKLDSDLEGFQDSLSSEGEEVKQAETFLPPLTNDINTKMINSSFYNKINNQKYEIPTKSATNFQDQLFVDNKNYNLQSQDIQRKIEQTIRVDLPSTKNEYHSLAADIAAGWRPNFGKEQLPAPIPLDFKEKNIDKIVRSLFKSKKSKLIYLGNRPRTSYDFFRSYYSSAVCFKYANILLQPDVLRQFNILESEEEHVDRPFEGMNEFQKKPKRFLFEGRFEGGNLDCVVKLSETQEEYGIIMRIDSNLESSDCNWFHFAMTPTGENYQKGLKIILSILNFPYKGQSFYFKEEGHSDWTPIASNLLKSASSSIFPNKFQVSFEYEFKNNIPSSVYFASAKPYTYSNLISFTKGFLSQYEKTTVQYNNLCKTLSGLRVPVLTFTDFIDNSIPIITRPIVFIIARCHPSETISSYACQGLMEALAQNTDLEIQKMMKSMIFKVLPMAEIDGVVIGNSHGGLTGINSWSQILQSSDIDIQQQESLFPIFTSLKQMIQQLKDTSQRIQLIIDLQSLNRSDKLFTIGSKYSPKDLGYFQSRLLPRLVANRLGLGDYVYLEQKQENAYSNLCETFQLTLNIPSLQCINQGKDQQEQSWSIFGTHLALSIYDYVFMMTTYETIKLASESRNKLSQISSNNFNKLKQNIKIQASSPLSLERRKKQEFKSTEIAGQESQSMWFNLAGIFKEIKEYEESKGNQSTDQFQDLLRAHELPSINQSKRDFLSKIYQKKSKFNELIFCKIPFDRKSQKNKDFVNKQLHTVQSTKKVINLDDSQDIYHHNDQINVRPNASADVFLADLIKKKQSRNYRLKLEKSNCKQFEDSMIYNTNEQQKANRERNNNDTTSYQLKQKQFLSTLKDKESYQLFQETDLSPRVTDFVRKNASGKTNNTLKRQFHSFNAKSQQDQYSVKKALIPSDFLRDSSIPRTLSPPPFSTKEKPRLKQISAQLPNKINSPSLHVRSVDSSVINNLDISPIQAFIFQKNQKKSKTNEKISDNHVKDYNILRENFHVLRQDIETSISSDMIASLILNQNNLNLSNEYPNRFEIRQGKHMKTSNSLEKNYNSSGKNTTNIKYDFRRIKTLGAERSISKQRNRQKEDISAWQEGQQSFFEATDPFLDIDFKTILPSIEKIDRYPSTKVQKFLKEQGHTKIRECLNLLADKRTTHAKQAEQMFPLLE